MEGHCSKTTKFYETFQFSKLTTSKTKQFCKTSFENGKLSAELTASCQCLSRICHSIYLKYCACHEKLMPDHTKCCNYHAKACKSTSRSDSPPNISDEHSNVPRPPSFLKLLQNHRLARFWQGAQSLAPATQNHILASKKWSSKTLSL